MEPKPDTAMNKHELSLILAVAVIQGWALYALHLSIKDVHWPATEPGWLVALYAVTLLAPLSFQVLVAHWQAPLTRVFLAALGISLFYFGWHHGVAVIGVFAEQKPDLEEAVVLAPILALLWLHLLPFVQCRLVTGQWWPQYRLLFGIAWRNVLTLGEAAIFTALFWALLMLWQGLFGMLGIKFFKDLFSEPIFIYPVTAITFGLALYLIGSLERWTEVVLEQILNVLKWLAVVAGLILTLFTAALLLKLPDLVFTGSRAIGAAWLLWLIAVVVLLVNAAFRDGTLERPYPQWINHALRFCMPLLVVVAVTAAYSLYVRATNYGLTVSRVWAMVVAAVALSYAIGYSYAAIVKGRWMARIAPVNIGVALGVIAVIALCLTPLLSPYRLSANSQYQRALVWQPDNTDDDNENGYGSAYGTPMHYLRFDAGGYGRDRLAALAASQDKQLSERAVAMQKEEHRRDARIAPDPQLLDDLAVYPAGHSIDPTLLTLLRAQLIDPKSPLRKGSISKNRLAGLVVDLNADGRDEFILFVNALGHVYQQTDTAWSHVGVVDTKDYPVQAADIRTALSDGKFTTELLEWRNLKIGQYRFRFSPGDVNAVEVDE